MLSAKLTTLTKEYTIDSDEKYVYKVTSRLVGDREEVKLMKYERNFNASLGVANEYYLGDTWSYVPSDVPNAHQFASIEEAFGFLNNLLIDEYKIGTPVVATCTRGEGEARTYAGLLVVNPFYNDEYPYRIEMEDNTQGAFSVAEVSNS